MRTTKILFLGSFPPPFGGIASHLYDLFKVFADAKRDFYVFDIYQRDLSNDEGYLHLRSQKRRGKLFSHLSSLFCFVRYLNRFTIVLFQTVKFYGKGDQEFLFPFKVVLTLIELIKTIRNDGITTLSAYHTFPEGMYAYFIRKYFFTEICYSVTVFGELQADTIHISKHEKLYNQILKNANILMASSQYCGSGVEKVGLSTAKVSVIPYGIDIDHFKRTIPYEETKSKRKILFVGHINVRMGLECLLNALAILKKKSIETNVIIVGNDHGFLSEFTKLVNTFGLVDNISIQKNVSYNALRTIYDESYLYVNTANTKLPCMGLSMKEAMASELPVIASNAGGIPEAVVIGETGYIFPADDAIELAKYIELTLTNFELSKKMGKSGRRRAEEIFDKNKTSQNILDILNMMEKNL
ncbi:MAG: glycosyltransferase family 4 protein [Ignavibacteriales bacterium]|nr:glycosyltransferase family 4 protein [Ignavibacteriales bacterium]